MACIHPFGNWWRLGRLVSRGALRNTTEVTLTSPGCFARGSGRYGQQRLPQPIENARYARHLAHKRNSRMSSPCTNRCNDQEGDRHSHFLEFARGIEHLCGC